MLLDSKRQQQATVERERETFARRWCQRTWTILGSAGCDASWMRRICEFLDRNAGCTAREAQDGIALRRRRGGEGEWRGRKDRREGGREGESSAKS
jgi:hypothetical protein